MTALRLRFVHRYRDRHGKIRHYVRMRGKPQVSLPGKPGSPEFMEAYQHAIAGEAPPPQKAAPGHIAKESFAALASAYLHSNHYRALAASSQAAYGRIVKSLQVKWGDKPVALIEKRHIVKWMEDRADKPAAANHLLRTLRHLMAYAVANGWRPDDPSETVKRVSYTEKPHPPWTEEDIALFEGHWAVGTKQRLAMDLLLYTGQRRSDVVRMGRQHVRGDSIFVCQVKTKMELLIKVHRNLRSSLEHVPPQQLTFLMTEAGDPYSPNGFYNSFVEWAQEAGVAKGKSPHGLRKAQGRRLAETGCTAPEIMSILGHKTLAEAQKYIDDFERAKAGRAAIVKLERLRRRR